MTQAVEPEERARDLCPRSKQPDHLSCRTCGRIAQALREVEIETARKAARAVCESCESGEPVLPDRAHFHACGAIGVGLVCGSDHEYRDGVAGYTLSCSAEPIWRAFPHALPVPESKE
jgi:hypothetical protein